VGAARQLSDRPLVLVGNGDDPDSREAKFGFGDLRKLFARDTAQRISALLAGGTGAKRVDRKGNERPILPGDIAVLVRSRYEAEAVREALAAPEIGLRCVYVSQKDSVFSDSEIAGDIYHILVAINENRDRRRLKSALATPLMRGFSVHFDETDRLEDDDEALENLIEEFGNCREAWAGKGILTALNRLLANEERSLFRKISTRPDSDRILTDLRHLGDLLQQQDLLSDSPEQLIDWYASQLDDDSALDEDSKRIRLESDENLVRIVTVFVAKGLEYPVVFLPFFYMPRPVDMNRQLPLYRREDRGEYEAVVDFVSPGEFVQEAIEKEILAEEMRLFYVAVTRAIFQCYIGVSHSTYLKKAMFGRTVWAHLLDIGKDSPDWYDIRAAMEKRLEPVSENVAYSVAGDIDPVRYEAPAGSEVEISDTAPSVSAPASDWRVTSYSSLARGRSPVPDWKDDDESPGDLSETDQLPVETEEAKWQFNARYWLQGSAATGSCLHEILEQQVLDPAMNLDDFGDRAFERLAFYGLDKPYRQGHWSEQKYAEYCKNYERSFKNWMRQILNQRLALAGRAQCPSLSELFNSGHAIPEMAFDFAIGTYGKSRFSRINSALADSGVSGIRGDGEIEGLMNGSIDLVFVHDKRIYIVDYKSNTLGRTPEFYDDAGMTGCMTAKRYDLQYMIYSVAAHRYFRQRLGARYSYDGGEYSFGGVFYLFLRGMGLDAPYLENGIWFQRPGHARISALDQAFLGGDSAAGQGGGP
jgi:exodeoxyribonuclease V beta subunit